MSIAYLNGELAPLEQTRVSVLDRGFLFGDGVYEVIPAYQGRLFRLHEHLDRLGRSLAAIEIDDPHTREGWVDLLEDLVARNGGGGQHVYLQVTRGVAPRNHSFPKGVWPTVFAMSKPMPPERAVTLLGAITRPDNRWGRCDIKSIALLPNVLLRQAATAGGHAEAILLRDGQVTEGAATNVFIVREDVIVTPAKDHRLLAGITRDLVVELAEAAGLPVVEGPVSEAALRGAEEIWLTSTTLEVAPVVSLDGVPVGGGRPGVVWRRMDKLFQAYKTGLADGGG